MKPDRIEQPSVTPSESGDVDSETVREAIRHAEDVKRQELEKAFHRLEAHGDLTDRQRRIITQLATAIVDDIVVSPGAALQNTSDYDSETVRIATELFDPSR